MKQTLQLKLTQHLTLTPQLQQSIRLLQLSTIELNAEVERMLQENPLLEKAEADDEPPAGAVAPGALPRAGDGAVSAGEIAMDSRTRSEEPRATDDERASGAETGDGAEFDDYSGSQSDWGAGGSGADDGDDD